MNPLIVLLLAPALTLPVVGDDPAAAEGPLAGVSLPGGDLLSDAGLEASVEANASVAHVTVDTDDLGLYLNAALPGPGFSRPVDATAPQAEVRTPAHGDQEGQGWGPAVPVPMPEPEEVAIGSGLVALGAVAYAAARWRLIGPWFLLPLYSRLSRSDILEHETRAKLLEVIEAEPGLSLQELSEHSDAGWGTTVYHLQRLEQAGFIKSEKQGHHRRFYKVGEVGREEVEALGMLRNDTPRKIAQYLVQDPGCNQKAICEALDISPSLAHKYLKRLEEQELITSEREWRSKHYTPDDRLAALVQQAA